MFIGRGKMNVLPNFEKAVVPREKLTQYSLNVDKDADKAFAFRLALGYAEKDADDLSANILQNTGNFIAISKGHNGFGELFECVMELVGTNGKCANVLTAWIVEDGTDHPRMINAYVTKKKVR